MLETSSLSSRLVMLAVAIVLLGLACSAESFIVTLTPTSVKDIIPTMTTLPTVVYPTLTAPPNTPTELPGMFCSDYKVEIICKAAACTVRNDPHSGKDNVAYTVPKNTVLDEAVVCLCTDCAPLERDWFFLGQSGEEQFWAIDMNQVWELYNGE